MIIGKRINGRYKILELIGGGGMSNVYLAHDVILDRDVAIKILRYDFSNEEELRRRFQREALSTTSLAHPNIVNIFDVGEDKDMHYLVMEYVPGKTLKDYIIDFAPVEPERSVQIMKQLASGLEHAHHNQIIHRDIKPQNILMDAEGNVKISDFGIAMALSATSYTQTNSVLGTVHYLSPEQARGGMANKKSDIYSLGIVMFELLTGRLPFSGESAVSIALKHLQTETPSLREIVPTLPQSLENIVLKATAKRPEHRYQTVGEMEEDLSTALLPERLNEPKFVIPIDDDETRAMPVIKDAAAYGNVEETKTAVPTAAKPVAEPVKQKPAKPVKKRKKWPVILLSVIAFLLIGGIVTALAFPDLFEPKQIEVPDVAGMERDEAREELRANGFELGEEAEQASEEVAAGLVIRTIPEAGKLRDPGAEVQLYISSGKVMKELGDYTGRTIERATELLEEQGFTQFEQEEQFSDQPGGTVLEQLPEPGSEVAVSDTTIRFVVSKGKDMREVQDMTGFTEEEMREYARSSGFHIRVVGEENSTTIPQGNVLSQRPAAGTEVEAGGDIEVTLSLGTPALPMKTYIQTIDIPYDAEETEEPLEQEIRIFIQDSNRTMDEPVETFTIIENESRRIQMQIEEGASATYRVTRDGEVIIEETINYNNVE
ncbi:Stk1 family PASTA domain-containing Ser/Thr kinase [Planomicrobium sp. YIM 101495]|uniref:Stk1 family PASTA domain-containing Ser/Thr kinase n=1 Tax=Planomicrobium sp. YIM 101495 TaxID=2665160 RepID=UPI0012BA0037|nr:Stk1 family PASTA domain-containing Ser/Thr kinase [Planomicrobium sp. YIM 101495]MTD30288.1 Stk1 family PASTA domain-containing Ser/Thr kinase [Planomicrobium sp. YIM 101495]